MYTPRGLFNGGAASRCMALRLDISGTSVDACSALTLAMNIRAHCRELRCLRLIMTGTGLPAASLTEIRGVLCCVPTAQVDA
jgi:hypothetical protein